MMLFTLVPLLLMQANPANSDSDPARDLRDRPSREQAPAQQVQPAPAEQARLRECLNLAMSDPFEAEETASEWLDTAKGSERARAGHCLAQAYGKVSRWSEALSAAETALSQTAVSDHAYRALLGTYAGNAAILSGETERAVELLEAAGMEAAKLDDLPLVSSIALDKVRALILLARYDEASRLLAGIRETLPGNLEVWLNSAVVARSQNNLEEAQQMIERAAELAPVDLSVGLEAGRIAWVAGRDDAARKSWQSVIDAKPDSDEAKLARSYMTRLEDPS